MMEAKDMAKKKRNQNKTKMPLKVKCLYPVCLLSTQTLIHVPIERFPPNCLYLLPVL